MIAAPGRTDLAAQSRTEEPTPGAGALSHSCPVGYHSAREKNGRVPRSLRKGGDPVSGWRSVAAAAIAACIAVGGGAGPAAAQGSTPTPAQTGKPAAQTKPEGEMRFALYVTVPPAWLD